MCLPCLPMLAWIVYVGLPYAWLVMMPVVGYLSGMHAVLRLSILLLLQSYLSTLVPRHLVLAKPLVQVGIVIGLLSMPVSLTPLLLVRLYSWLLWASEPFWLILEVLGVVKLSISCSRYLMERVDDQPHLAKGSIYLISVICYCVMFNLFWVITLSNASVVKSLLAPIVVLATLVHIAVWFSDTGVVSDAAVVSAFTMALLYSMMLEAADSPYGTATDSTDSFSGVSFSSLMWTSLATSLGRFTETWHFFLKLIHPWFIAAAIVRIHSVLLAIDWLKTWLGKEGAEDDFLLEDDDDEDEDDLEDEDSVMRLMNAWKSPLMVRLVVIFVYTQLVIHHIHSPGPLYNWSLGLPLLGNVSVARMTQIFFVNCYYLHFLWREHTQDIYDL